MNSIGAVIMAGGKNRRMQGRDKALFTYGGVTFLERLTGELKGFSEVLLSVDRAERYPDCGLHVIIDDYPECGPISGLCTALRVCRSDLLFVVACDMPLVSHKLAELLCAYVSPETDAVIPVTGDGQIHPYCGLYRKRAYRTLKDHIDHKQYRIMDAYPAMNVEYISLAHSGCSDEMLRNINTPEEYAALT